MMSDATPLFRKPGSQGWLVLCNRIPKLGNQTPLLIERMLEVVDLSFPPLCLTLDSTAAEDLQVFLDDYKTLTGVDVALIDLWDLDYQEMVKAVSQAGLVVMTGGLLLDWAERIDPRGDGNSADDFLLNGRMLMAVGPVVANLGAYVLSPVEGEIIAGLGWMPGAMVLPDEIAPIDIAAVRHWLSGEENSYAIGLPHESIFALGPQGEVEVWGVSKPVISLGKGWRNE